ncbi:hypothetical protein KY290_029413 [Solanum tuberosum]|uniref:Uncharacterized protein n=1 Tax=Solanum tuberosum TaxID=4113 RepID=A0ABQ7UKN4_SOLTU|nr:hypothetical protein KY289_028155 [Solanum tuberosum]KAH0750181.1 hypothetical protein KY290_029413 [Solanum tuberosum]
MGGGICLFSVRMEGEEGVCWYAMEDGEETPFLMVRGGSPEVWRKENIEDENEAGDSTRNWSQRRKSLPTRTSGAAAA